MNNKNVIGLNLKYFDYAVGGVFLMAISLILPYINVADGHKNFISAVIGLLKSSDGQGINLMVYLTVIISIASLILGLISFYATSVRIVKIWQVLQAFATAFWTFLLFASKTILEKAEIAKGFTNKQLSFGFWIGIIAAYVSLVLIMRTTRTNVGYIALTILGVIWMFPILWIILTALRAEQGYYVGYFFPKKLTLQNFTNLFSNNSVIPFKKWWVNTFIVATASCIINTLIILATSFTLSRTRFAGRKAFMNVLMVIGLFPGFMSLIAVYNILKGLGLNQSLLALVVVGAAGAAMGYHVTKGFFDTIPKAIDEAAIIDGATRFQIFTHITLPLSKPIIVYTVLGSFLASWSDYIFPSMLFGDKQSSYTVAVGLYWLTDFRRIDRYYTQFAAGAVIVAVPIVILFIWLQRYYVEGLSGSVKG